MLALMIQFEATDFPKLRKVERGVEPEFPVLNERQVAPKGIQQ
jgi:hypothetical protein